MELMLVYTWQSGHGSETIQDVKSWERKGVWTVMVTYNDGRTEPFYAVDLVREFS